MIKLIWYLGFDLDSIVLFNSDLFQFKSLNKEKFFKELLGESFEVLVTLDEDKLKSKLSKLDFPLANTEDLISGILYDTKCQYFLEMNTSTHMTVATYKMQAEVVKRIDNAEKVLNAEVYWMTWPETEGYIYGNSIPCSAFQYVCEIGTDYLSAKKELLNFANTGLAEILERQMLFGLSTGYKESKSLKGLCAYEYKEEASQNVVEVEEGVTVLDFNAIPRGVTIKKLILPSTLMFIQPEAINGEVYYLDLSKTAVTKLYDIFGNAAKINYISLPNSLIEMSKIGKDSFIGQTQVTIPKSVRYVQDIYTLSYDIEDGSELVYMGASSLVATRARTGIKRNLYKKVLIDDLSTSRFAYVLDTPNLQTIDGDIFYDTKSSNIWIMIVHAKLNRMMKSYYTKLNKKEIGFLVEADSDLYKELKGKINRLQTYSGDFKIC